MITNPSGDSKRAYGAVDVHSPAFSGFGDNGDIDAVLAGPSSAMLPPPPSFEESVNASSSTSPPPHTLISIGSDSIFIPPGGEEAPPAFAPYEAEYALASDGIVSHDAHLNTDGEALYRFLLSHAATPPSYVLHIAGTHEETRTRLATHTDSNGKEHTRSEAYTETVTDFDFKIDVGQHIMASASLGSADVTHWSVADQVPAYRGGMRRKVGIPPHLQKPDKKAKRVAERWDGERQRRGLPPWVGEDRSPGDEERNPYSVLQSSWTLRQWADDYCASPKYLKEFVYERVVYGWNTESLTAAVRAAVLSTHYTGALTVAFETSSSRICIRSSNRLSRTLSNTWLKVLLIVTLIYPFIALFRRFHPRGGGRWEVCGGAYALKKFADAPAADLLLDDTSAPGNAVAKDRLVKTRAGVKVLKGVREGEWYQRWESTIRGAVMGRRQDTMPLTHPETYSWNPAAEILDGYVSRS